MLAVVFPVAAALALQLLVAGFQSLPPSAEAPVGYPVEFLLVLSRYTFMGPFPGEAWSVNANLTLLATRTKGTQSAASKTLGLGSGAVTPFPSNH